MVITYINTAGKEVHLGGSVIQRMTSGIRAKRGRFQAFPAGLFKNLGELAPALEFIEYVVASGEPAQTVGETPMMPDSVTGSYCGSSLTS
jgi:hypothetical protein